MLTMTTTGALLANHTLKAIGVSGDGDSASIGIGQFVHVMRRGVNMVYIVENNGVYGLTKGQFSATADKGSKAKKGAINADKDVYGIIPGSMGAKSFIVKGRGLPESFNSCSHGAGRKLSRGAAKRAFTREDLERQTAGVECRKDVGVLDEIPGAYKSIEAVMKNQEDLVEVVAEIKQVVCVKG